MNTIQLVDDTGTARSIPLQNLYEELARGDFQLYGMGIPAILRLRAEYQKLGGMMPITEESVKEVFSRGKTV